ncbi:MAG TPA: hypothetical protein VN213_12095 [Solirubrobacteraceae bacterium]|nr:hypothetical protein [Solirubrobacteraceae bacterium]
MSTVAGLGTAAARGAAAGLAGVAVMTAAEKLEQRFTGRPSSYVPAKTMSRLLGLSRPDRESWPRNMAMHYGNGVVLGAVRGIMAAANLRGPQAATLHAPLRLAWDQTLENLTGVGAPPWTWPRDELLIDVVHKTVFSLATGAVTDAIVEPLATSSARRRGLGLRLKGLA